MKMFDYFYKLKCRCSYKELGFRYCARHGALIYTILRGKVLTNDFLVYETNKYIHMLKIYPDKMVLTLQHKYIKGKRFQYVFKAHGIPSTYYYAVKILLERGITPPAPRKYLEKAKEEIEAEDEL